MSIADRIDTDLEAHMQCFLAALPGQLGLSRIQDLDCSDPVRTLGVLAEIKAAVDRERRKVQALESLVRQNGVNPPCSGQNAQPNTLRTLS